jgi:hypothetical protein
MRSVPFEASPVSTGWNPAAETASAISRESVKQTMRSKHAASAARSRACTTTGLPPKDCNSFPGKRVEPRRAGTTHATPVSMRL